MDTAFETTFTKEKLKVQSMNDTYYFNQVIKQSTLYEMDVCYFWFMSVLTGLSILLNLHDIQSLKTSGVCKQYE